jgi:hypothetical protein
MNDIFSFGAQAECPECGNPCFTGSAHIHPGELLTCADCGGSCTAEDALRAGWSSIKVDKTPLVLPAVRTKD